MPGSRLKIGFHGNEKTPEQISIIPFREGDDVEEMWDAMLFKLKAAEASMP
jgi:hypothetical protein